VSDDDGQRDDESADPRLDAGDEPPWEPDRRSRRDRAWDLLVRTPRWAILLAALAVALAVGALIGRSDDATTTEPTGTTTTAALPPSAELDVNRLLDADDQFLTFRGLIDRADMRDELDGNGPITVFAPSTEAYAALGQDAVTAMMATPESARAEVERHVSTTDVRYGSLLAGTITTVEMLDGSTAAVTVDASTVTVGGEPLVKNDLLASNGVVHVTGAVAPAPG